MRLLIFVTLFSLVAAPAFAESAAVEKLIEEGIALREKQQDRKALAKFEAAYAQSKSARAQAQMALAHQALGDWLAAESNLSAALGSKDRWINKNRAALQGALKKMRGRLGRVEITSAVKGAAVRLNGTLVGTTPLNGPKFVVAGSVVIAVDADGHWPVSRRIDVAAGALARETVKLVEKQAAAPPPPKASPPVSSAGSATTDVGGGGDSMAYLGYGLAAGAVVGVGVGVAMLLVRNGKISEYNDDACLAGGMTRDENCGDKLDSANSAGTLSTVGFIAGGALAVGAAIVLVIASGSDGASTASTDVGGNGLVCGGGPGEIGLGCRVRF